DARPRVVKVAVALPVPGTYSYTLPDELAARVEVGACVLVPFGRRSAVGYVVGLEAPAPAELELKPVQDLVGETPPLDPAMIEFLLWAADYYLAPPGEMIRAALPAGAFAQASRRVRLLDRAARGRNAREQRLLEALLAAADGELSERSLRRQVGPLGGALVRLCERRAIERFEAAATPRVTVRREDTFALARTPTDEERRRLERAPRRAQVWARIAAAGGAPVALSALRELPRARAHAIALTRAGLLARGQRERVRDPFQGEPLPPHPAPVLHARQAEAVGALESALSRGGFAAFLLHGVTGSGKTEVYLRLIASARRSGRGAIVLVPEISLTPQLAARFRARFGDDVAVLHSGLTDGERYDAWRRLRAGGGGIALGARPAGFAPVGDLGVIVVDEEHDGSFKQEEGVRYHARDLALVRAQRAGALCVLGSATPSLESYHNATSAARLTLLELPERATPRPLPTVEVIDLRTHRPDRDGLLSAPLA